MKCFFKITRVILAILILIPLFSSCANDLNIDVPDDWFMAVIYAHDARSESHFRLYDDDFNIVGEILIKHPSINANRQRGENL